MVRIKNKRRGGKLKMKKIKNTKGITLIVLVITIIVLLVLTYFVFKRKDIKNQ